MGEVPKGQRDMEIGIMVVVIFLLLSPILIPLIWLQVLILNIKDKK